MSYDVVFPSGFCENRLLKFNKSPISVAWKGKLLNAAKWRQLAASCGSSKAPPLLIMKAHMGTPSTFSYRIATDMPFDESPEASFAQYLDYKPRVFRAICPENQASQQIDEDEWRIHMLPIKSPFLTLHPVIDMRLKCTSNVLEYPSGIPHSIPKILELEIIRSEFLRLDVINRSQFSLGVKGTLYCERLGVKSRLKGQTQMSISFIQPPLMALVSEHVYRDVVTSVLRSLAEDMKPKVNASLLADYSEFKRDRLKDLA